MAPRKPTAGPSRAAPGSFEGCWRIEEMALWEKEWIDTMGPAFISFRGAAGYFRFICVEGEIDCSFSEKKGRPHVEWTWDGQDESDPASGRGWATLDGDGVLKGRIYIHHGDNSAFTASRSEKDLHVRRIPPPYRRRR